MKKVFSLVLTIAVVMFFLTLPALAVNFNDALTGASTVAGTGGAGFDTANATVEGQIAKIINAALSMIGVIFLVLMIYGGYIWMAARGDEAEAKKAKGIITMAIIGLVVVVAAYAISAFVVGRLIAGATTPAAAP